MTTKPTGVRVRAYIEFKDPTGKSLWQEHIYESKREVATKLQRHLEILTFASPYIRNNYVEISYTLSLPA